MEKSMRIKTLEQARSEIKTLEQARSELHPDKALLGKQALTVYDWLKDNRAAWQTGETDNLKAFIISVSSEDAYNRLLRNINYYKCTLVTAEEKVKKQAEKATTKKRNTVLVEQELIALRQYQTEMGTVLADKDRLIAELQAEVKKYQLRRGR